MNTVQTYIGGRELVISDYDLNISFPTLVMYPTLVPSKPVSMGPYSLELAWDADIDAGEHPIVVISHGTGGTHLGYRTLAAHLALNGYVVLMPEHPGDNRNNNELANAPENLSNRPRHISLTIDALLHDPHFRSAVDTNRIAIIGHSMGGYTALAVAGGKPSTQQGQVVDVIADKRVKALVLLAPATPWFQEQDALREVIAPILMLTAEHDPHTPAWHANVVVQGLAEQTQLTHRVIKNAGHFSFMSPFPRAMQSPQFAPSTDPEGFDRASFQDTLKRDVLQFLIETL